MENHHCQHNGPCERLKQAAERLFSEKGFDATTTRQITQAAGCNVAAVNYHFGSKEKLYLEIFKDRLSAMRKARLEAISLVMNSSEPALEKLLSTFAHTFLEPLIHPETGRGILTLIHREMLDQRLPKDLFFCEMIGPMTEALAQSFICLCPSLTTEQSMCCVTSYLSQLLHFAHVRQMNNTENTPHFFRSEIDHYLNHITRFVAAGIRSYQERPAENG